MKMQKINNDSQKSKLREPVDANIIHNNNDIIIEKDMSIKQSF